MTKLFFLFMFWPLSGQAHPGIGIVKDSKGNIFYTDLKHVWKITNGDKIVVVPNVHSHELYVDNDDNLYGEGSHYDNQAEKFYHYLWVYRSNGQIDTIIGMKEAYGHHNFSLARDKNGNEYYLKRFLSPHTDTNHIYRKSPGGRETIFAAGKFKSVNWLHPQDDGSLLYVSNNTIYRVDSLGNKKLIKDHIANIKPSFKFSNNIMIWGLWQDNEKNIYAAIFSDQVVKKIDTRGNITDIFRSSGNWAPLHGVFENENKLWVLESSDKNDVRVTLVEIIPKSTEKINTTNSDLLSYFIICLLILSLGIFYLRFRNFKSAGLRN